MNIGFTGHRDRQFDETFLVELARLYPDALWVHGGADDGFDALVDRVAKRFGIKTRVIRPDYKKYPPKVAPLMRNPEIVDLSDVMVAGYDGRKKGGTYSTIKYAKGVGKTIHILKPKIVYHCMWDFGLTYSQP